jgi:Vacuolar protein sorting-associated protein 35
LCRGQIALKLFVQSGIAADKIGFSYEFFSQAFTLAELLDSAGQVRATSLLIASLRAINSVENEGYENLITRCVCGCFHRFEIRRASTSDMCDGCEQCCKAVLSFADEG